MKRTCAVCGSAVCECNKAYAPRRDRAHLGRHSTQHTATRAAMLPPLHALALQMAQVAAGGRDGVLAKSARQGEEATRPPVDMLEVMQGDPLELLILALASNENATANDVANFCNTAKITRGPCDGLMDRILEGICMQRGWYTDDVKWATEGLTWKEYFTMMRNMTKERRLALTTMHNANVVSEQQFVHSTSLVVQALPVGLKTIERQAFARCRSLTTMTLPQGLKTIGDEAFDYCQSLTTMTLPQGLETIGDGAFAQCQSLTTMTLPMTVTSLGRRVFSMCRALTSVVLPDGLRNIQASTCNECRALTNVTLPKGLLSIGQFAFQGCSALTSVVFPESLQSIGLGAFWYCQALTAVQFPQDLQTIGDFAFSGCASLLSVTVPQGCALEFETFDEHTTVHSA